MLMASSVVHWIVARATQASPLTLITITRPATIQTIPPRQQSFARLPFVCAMGLTPYLLHLLQTNFGLQQLPRFRTIQVCSKDVPIAKANTGKLSMASP